MSLQFRLAEEPDSVLVLAFIKELAVYEGMGKEVTATEEDIRQSLFLNSQASVLIAECDSRPAAFALFYPIYSTFLGRQNLFLEDLFVRDEYRGKGIGKALMQQLAEIALHNGAERLDWYVLEENVQGVEFYKKLGAIPLLDRRTYRLRATNLESLVNGVIAND